MKISFPIKKKGSSQTSEIINGLPSLSSPPPILPVLKSSQWAGIKSGLYYKEVLPSPVDVSLILTLGYDCNEHFRFLYQYELKGESKEMMYMQAIDHLLQHEVPFDISGKNNEQILFASGREYSSEKILCPDFMHQAHQLLQSDKLLVSIPRRRNMVIISSYAPESTKIALKNLHRYIWNDDSFGNAPIINALVEVEHGCLSQLIPMQ